MMSQTKICIYNILLLLVFFIMPMQALANFESKAYEYMRDNYPHIMIRDCKDIAYSVNFYSEKYNIPKRVLLAIVLSESSGIPTAKSHKGAIGLTQVRYAIWDDHLNRRNIAKSKSDLLKIHHSIEAGAFIFSQYFEGHRKIKKALLLYAGNNSTIVYDKVMAMIEDMNTNNVPR